MSTYFVNEEDFKNGLGKYLNSLGRKKVENGEFDFTLITEQGTMIDVYDYREDKTYEKFPNRILINLSKGSKEIKSKLEGFIKNVNTTI